MNTQPVTLTELDRQWLSDHNLPINTLSQVSEAFSRGVDHGKALSAIEISSLQAMLGDLPEAQDSMLKEIKNLRSVVAAMSKDVDTLQKLRVEYSKLTTAYELKVSEHHTMLMEFAQSRVYLTNLLARIHRDGGHHLAEHGLDQSVHDADMIVAIKNQREDQWLAGK